MPAALTPQSFAAKWRKVALKESAAAKEHFLDLCRLLDHPLSLRVSQQPMLDRINKIGAPAP